MLMTYSGHSLFLPNWFAANAARPGLAFSGVGVGSILIFPWLQRMIGSTGCATLVCPWLFCSW